MKPTQMTALVIVIGALLVFLALSQTQLASQQTIASDRFAIEKAISQYAYRWDTKNAEGFADLFTEDAAMERWVRGELKSEIKGRNAIKEYARESHQGRLADRQTRHHMSNIVFTEIGDDTALSENLVLITHQTAGSMPVPVSTGTYQIAWCKHDKDWKIMKRVLISDRGAE